MAHKTGGRQVMVSSHKPPSSRTTMALGIYPAADCSTASLCSAKRSCNNAACTTTCCSRSCLLWNLLLSLSLPLLFEVEFMAFWFFFSFFVKYMDLCHSAIKSFYLECI